MLLSNLLSFAADKDYDWMALREELHDEGVRLLIKHLTVSRGYLQELSSERFY